MIQKIIFLFALLATSYTAYNQVDDSMVSIPTGYYSPFIKGSDTLIKVNTFHLDEKQVTESAFKQFVEENPKWSKENVKLIFADNNYLFHWVNNQVVAEDVPVVNISWFAAKAYCQSVGKRLPTTNEWEYAAAALPENGDNQTLINIVDKWYGNRSSPVVKTGTVYRNTYGVWDMMGSVWEWVYDFNGVSSNDDSRNNEEVPEGLFCGSASLNASDASDYVTFMRFAFRSSLKGNYTVRKLGFRCAKSIDQNNLKN